MIEYEKNIENLLDEIDILEDDLQRFNRLVKNRKVENKNLNKLKMDIKNCRKYLNNLSKNINDTIIIKNS